MPQFPALPLWPHPAPGLRQDGIDDSPTLIPVLPEGEGSFPAIVVCAGGGYGGRAGHEGAPVAEWLASIGIAGLVVSDRFAPNRHPIPLTDAQRAIRLARSQAQAWNLDAKRVGILGFSAGGHLAASAATIHDTGLIVGDAIDQLPCRPDCAVLSYAVLTFGDHRHHGSMYNLFGTGIPARPLREALSPERQVSAATPPCFLWHTASDDAVPVQNSLLFASALAEQRVPFALHVYPEGQHGLGLAQGHASAGGWTRDCAEWLRQLGWR